MTKEARKRAILAFLDNTDLALPPKAIYVNMDRRGTITFSRKTVERLLKEMYESDGWVDKPLSAEGYYEISDSGRQHLRESRD